MDRNTLVELKIAVSKQFSGTTKYSKAFRRGNTQALDISQTFPTFEHAFVYALNDTENDNYVPYAGQVISEAENGNVYILRKYSSDVRYIDLPAGEGETLETYEIKNTDRFHYYLQEIKTVEGDNSKYLRADADSSNNGHTLTVGKLVSEKGADVTGNVNVTGDVNAEGNVTGKNVTATGKVTTPEVVTGGIHSEGADAQNGFIIGKETNGGYTMYVDNLHVRNKMTAETLEIEETTYVGGKLVLTPGAGIECSRVEHGNYSSGQGFKCWFVSELDGRKKYNTFQVGDLALCESFDNNQLKFYWREVVECGDDYIILSDVNGKYHTDSDKPEAGDKIVQCGNIYGGERASAIVLSSVDTGSPFVAQYKNIVTFEWTKPVTRLSDDGNIITGTLKTDSGKDVEKYINDTNETIVKLQEGMQSLGDDNFVIWQADYPSPKNDDNTISEEFTAESHEPSASWDKSEWNSHTGDYLICSDGIVYVFRCVENQETEYVWKIVTDKYLIDALNKALQAQETADEAKEGADNANQILANMCDDGIITAQEKIALSKTWDNMKVTYLTKRSEGLKYDYDTHNASIANALTEAYSNLVAAMESVLEDMTTDTDISGSISGHYNLSFVSCWGNYFDRFETYCEGLDDFIKTNTDKIGADATSALNTLKEMADDGIITSQEKISLKDWWNNELNEANSIIANAQKIYGNIEDSNANWYKFLTLKNLAVTLMGNVLSNMDSSSDISASGSIFVTKDAVQSATKDTSIQGTQRADKNLVWSEFWAIYYQYKATCQNTAEAKAKVFVTAENVLPTPPYKKGDMWICPRYEYKISQNSVPTIYIKETFVCETERKNGEEALFTDWQVMYDATSSHLEVLKDSIKLWVEKDSGIAEKIKSGIDLLAEGVMIYHTKSDGTEEQVNLIEVGENGIKINASLIDIEVPEFTLKGKTINLTGDDITIDSTYFKVSKYGNITATGGTIGGFKIGTSTIQAYGDNGNKNITLSPDYIWVGNSYSTDRYVRIDADGKITAKDVDLSGKITANSGKIANMDIASTEVSYQQQAEDGGYFSFGYDGIKAGYMTADGVGFKPVTTTTIGKDGSITAPNVEFKKDGSGHVAGGKIAWHTDGSLDVVGMNAVNGTFFGIVKANLFFSTIKKNTTSGYYINPEQDASNMYWWDYDHVSANGSHWIYLPDATLYEGIEIAFYWICGSTQAAKRLYVSGINGQNIVIVNNYVNKLENNAIVTYAILNGTSREDTRFRCLPNIFTKVKAINGKWYIIEGSTTEE